MYLDADTHIDECDDTWAFMPKELTPTTIQFAPDQIPPWLPGPTARVDQSRFWFMDGQLHSQRRRNNASTGTTEATREMRDIPGRLGHMDEIGVDIQILYPTTLLHQRTLRTDLDVALCRSYNRWLAERCARTNGRMRFVALPPLSSMPDALEEIAWAKDNGAVGVYKRGIEWDRPIHHPDFHPLYKLAEELDLPICVHASLPWAPVDPHFSRLDEPYFLNSGELTVLQAFHALLNRPLTDKFPNLRWGFIEAGSTWVTALFEMARLKKTVTSLAERNFFVTAEPDEDLAYFIEIFGDDYLMVGTDYSHADRSGVMDKHQSITARTDISPTAAMNITSEAARRFYGV